MHKSFSCSWDLFSRQTCSAGTWYPYDSFLSYFTELSNPVFIRMRRAFKKCFLNLHPLSALSRANRWSRDEAKQADAHCPYGLFLLPVYGQSSCPFACPPAPPFTWLDGNCEESTGKSTDAISPKRTPWNLSGCASKQVYRLHAFLSRR